MPQKGAEEIEMKLAPVTKTIKAPALNIPKPKSQKQVDSGYDSISLSSPLDNGVVRNNTSTVTLSANVQPSLQKVIVFGFLSMVA